MNNLDENFINFIESYSEISFTGGSFHKACNILKSIFTLEDDIQIFLSLSGALVPAGLQKTIVSLLDTGKITGVITTGATLTHDYIENLGFKHKKLHNFQNDAKLRQEGINRILDVGSGAGLPGIPLAIMSPNKEFVLLDSNGKKTRFIKQVIIDLGLKNVEAVNSRVDAYLAKQPFDEIMTRAFAEINDTILMCKQLCDQHTRFLFMKSKNVDHELDVISSNYHIEHIDLHVPDLEAKRSLVIVTRNAN